MIIPGIRPTSIRAAPTKMTPTVAAAVVKSHAAAGWIGD
jgi:hypothetical protein